MKIEVRFRGMATSDALRDQVGRRLHFQLSRFNGEISAVIVRISDINGPKGGPDKRCQVTVRGPAFGSVTIEDLSADPYSAVDMALERAARAVRRQIERTRVIRRADGELGRAS